MPLLGTKTFQNIVNVEKSPLRGPINHVCYTNLLHSSGSKQPQKPQKTAHNRARNCYTTLLHNVPNGLCVRSGRFYYRRRIPHDVRELIGRTEIWRSLGRKLINGTLEAPKWRTYRAKPPAGKAGCLSKDGFGRDGSHLGVPEGFDQKGPALRWTGLK